MIEMKVTDVLVRSGEGAAETVVVLEETDGERRLPIWVGPSEGMALGYRVVGDEPQRPLTSDLMAELVRTTGTTVDSVAITELRDTTFHGRVTVDGIELDARPSDALNLAVRVGAPILVAEQVLEAREATGQEPDGDWESITFELLAAFHRPGKKE